MGWAAKLPCLRGVAAHPSNRANTYKRGEAEIPGLTLAGPNSQPSELVGRFRARPCSPTKTFSTVHRAGLSTG